MEKILEKISSYNLFNYLFPGVVFCVVADRYLAIPILQESIVNGLFLYYFAGLVISRFGSIVIEPILRKTRFVTFAEYQTFIEAAKQDPKIDLLSESNNTYRTLLSALIILCVLAIGSYLAKSYPSLQYIQYLILPGILILLAFSYKKQTEYIAKRVSSALKIEQRE